MNNLSKQNVSISIIDVGHGNSTVIIEGKRAVIIDTGRGTSLLEFLKEKGINEIDTILISHADEDHVGGLIGIVSSEEFKINRIRLNTDSIKETNTWETLLYTLNKHHMEGDIDFDTSLNIRDKDSGAYDIAGVNIKILAPNLYLSGKGPGSNVNGLKLTSNSLSAVVLLTYEDKPIVLLPSDVDEIAFKSLKNDNGNILSEILVFPHHGGKIGKLNMIEFTKELCENSKPNFVIFSIGRGKYSNPLPGVVSTVNEVLPETKIMCTQLSNHCSNEIPSTSPEHLLPCFARGKEKLYCCAGTIVINLNDSGYEVLPDISEHSSFIEHFVEKPLCKQEN